MLVVTPDQPIFEGDPLTIECTVGSLVGSSEGMNLTLSQGNLYLGQGAARVDHSKTAVLQEPEEFKCILKTRNVVKVVTKTVPVSGEARLWTPLTPTLMLMVKVCLSSELFSAPSLSMAPSEVFQKEPLTLTCRSETVASERLSRDELVYSLLPADHLQRRDNGVFYGTALPRHFNYTCAAQAKHLVKLSRVLTVRPKGRKRAAAVPAVPAVPPSSCPRCSRPSGASPPSVSAVAVSVPRISVLGWAILGRPVQVLCQSDSGSLPINYTLLRGYEPVDAVSVQLSSERAVFSVSVSSAAELSSLMCEARNHPREAPLSRRLEATLVGGCPTLAVPPPAALWRSGWREEQLPCPGTDGLSFVLRAAV